VASASSRPASEPAVIAGSADAAATETAPTPLLPAADPEQPSLPFDVGEAHAPDEVPAARHGWGAAAEQVVAELLALHTGALDR